MFHALGRLPWHWSGFGPGARGTIKSFADLEEARRLVQLSKAEQSLLCLGWLGVLIAGVMVLVYIWHRCQRRRQSQLLATVASSTKRSLIAAARENEAKAALLGIPGTASGAFSRVTTVGSEYLPYGATGSAGARSGAGYSDNPVNPTPGGAGLRHRARGPGLEEAYDSDSADFSAMVHGRGCDVLQQLQQLFKLQLTPTAAQLGNVQALLRKPRRCIGGCSCFCGWAEDKSNASESQPHPFLSHCARHADTGCRPDGIAHLSTVAVRLGSWLCVTYCTGPKEAAQRVEAHRQQPLAHHLAALLEDIVREVAVDFHSCTAEAVQQLLGGLSSESQLRLCSMMCAYATPALPSPAIPLLLLHLVSTCSAASYSRQFGRITTLASLLVDDFVELLRADMAEDDGPLSSILGSLGPLSLLDSDVDLNSALYPATSVGACAGACTPSSPAAGSPLRGDEGEGEGEDESAVEDQARASVSQMDAVWYVLEGLLMTALHHSPSVVHGWLAHACRSQHRSEAHQLNAAMAVLGLACRIAKHVKYASNLPPHAPQLPSLRGLRPLRPLPSHLDAHALYPASPQSALQELCQLALHDLVLPMMQKFQEQRTQLMRSTSTPQRVVEMHRRAWSGVIHHRRFVRHLMSALGFQSVWLLRHLAPLLDPAVVAARDSLTDTPTRLEMTAFWHKVQRAAQRLGSGVTSNDVMGVLGTAPVRCLIDLCRGVEMMVTVQPSQQLTAVSRKSLCHACDLLVVLLALPEVRGGAANTQLLQAVVEALLAVQQAMGDSLLATRPTATRHLLPALYKAYACLPEVQGSEAQVVGEVSLRRDMLRLMESAVSREGEGSCATLTQPPVTSLLRDAARLATMPHPRDESLEVVRLAMDLILGAATRHPTVLHDIAYPIATSLVSLLGDLSSPVLLASGGDSGEVEAGLGRAVQAASQLALYVLRDLVVAAKLPMPRLQEVAGQLRSMAQTITAAGKACDEDSEAVASAVAELWDAVHGHSPQRAAIGV